MKKDIKYIIKRVIIGVGIILVMSLIRTCEVHAETEIANLTIANSSFSSHYNIGLAAGATTSPRFDIYTTIPTASTLVMDFCSGIDLSNNDLFKRTYAIGTSCPNSCYSNTIIRVNMGTNCTSSNGYDGQYFRVYVPITKIDFGAGCGQSGCNGQVKDNFTFTNGLAWWTFAELNGAYITDEIVTGNDTAILSKVNTSINNLNSSINNAASQAHTDSQNTQNAINNQTQTQHNDSVAEQNAINNQTNAITDSSIPSDTNNQVTNILTHASSSNANVSDLVNFIPNLIQQIINGFNTSCTGGYSLGTLFGTELTIPCINPVDYLGSFLWGVIDSILCLCYLIPLCKFLVNKYNELTSLKNLRWE